MFLIGAWNYLCFLLSIGFPSNNLHIFSILDSSPRRVSWARCRTTSPAWRTSRRRSSTWPAPARRRWSSPPSWSASSRRATRSSTSQRPWTSTPSRRYQSLKVINNASRSQSVRGHGRIRTQRAAVASRRDTNIATHLLQLSYPSPYHLSHPPPFEFYSCCGSTLVSMHIQKNIPEKYTLCKYKT